MPDPITTFPSKEAAQASQAFLSAVRILAKPYAPGSVRLECAEIQPRVDAILVIDTPDEIVDCVVVRPRQGHYEYAVQEGYVAPTALTAEQAAAGWTLLLTREQLVQYGVDNRAAAELETAAQ